MVASVPQAHQWLSARRIIAALVVVVCLSAPVAGVVGETGQSNAASAESIAPTDSVVTQAKSPVTGNGTVTINETATNRSRIVLKNVTLPKHGYIVARTGNLSANQSATKVVGHTQYVRNGSYEDVILALNETVGKGATVVVTIHNDTNGNKTWDGIQTDAAYVVNGTPIHDSIPFDTSENTNQSRNQSIASVVFKNQTTNGSSITVKQATLPKGGYIVLHSDPMSQIGYLEPTMIAVSGYLAPGTHRNITINVSHSPPGGLVNRTRLTDSEKYSVGLYQDTNNNKRFEYILPGKEVDGAYFVGSKTNTHIASDTAHITIPGSTPTPTPTASIQFENQTVSNSTVVIESVALPNGGFVVVHSENYLHDGNPLASVVGHSQYLSPGTHHNVSVTVNGSIQQVQTFVAIPARDTNGNHRYDFISSDGFRDVAYTGNGQIITDRAIISPPKSATSTPSPTSQNTSQPSMQSHDAGDSDGGTGISAVNLVAACLLLVVGGYVIFYARS